MFSDQKVSPLIPVLDFDRAKKFYSEKLGLKETGGFDDVAIYQCGGDTTITIYKRASNKAEHTLAGWMTDDLEATMKELRDRGVQFEEYDEPDLKTVNGVFSYGAVKSAWFKDSEGNILSVNQMTPA